MEQLALLDLCWRKSQHRRHRWNITYGGNFFGHHRRQRHSASG
jgi:hypothetical protein